MTDSQDIASGGQGRCAYPWQQMIIDLTGEVVPCCFWSGYGNTGRPLGNTNERSLDEIWNGPAYRELRAVNAAPDGPPAGHPCHQCMAWRWAEGRYPPFDWPGSLRPEAGHAYVTALPEAFRAEPGAPAGDAPVLYEDDVPLTRCDDHGEIRREGGGRYSVWGGMLYLSSRDGSDPVTNGRRYELRRADRTLRIGSLRRDSPSGRNLLAAYREYRSGAVELEARPSMLSFISTADCNIDCPACSQNTVRLARVQHRPETEPDVLAHVPNLHQFIWHGGEPYLIRGFREFIDGFRTEHNPNLTFGFTTNGTLLDAEELAKLDRFPRLNASISVDSFVRETFETIRKGARFDTVIENVLRAVATSRTPDRVISVGMIVVKSNLLELPSNLRWALDHDIGLNLSPVVVYPVTERLDVFGDVSAQTVGWDEALEEALAVAREARARGRLAIRRVDPTGMIEEIREILRRARARHAAEVPLRFSLDDPTSSLTRMRRPGVIVAAEGCQHQPLAYVEVPGPGTYEVGLPETDLAGAERVLLDVVHDMLEPMGAVARLALVRRRGRLFTEEGQREILLRVPAFEPVSRPRNATLAHAGLATPDGLFVTRPADVYEAYLALRAREAAAGRGAQLDGTRDGRLVAEEHSGESTRTGPEFPT